MMDRFKLSWIYFEVLKRATRLLLEAPKPEPTWDEIMTPTEETAESLLESTPLPRHAR